MVYARAGPIVSTSYLSVGNQFWRSMPTPSSPEQHGGQGEEENHNADGSIDGEED